MRGKGIGSVLRDRVPFLRWSWIRFVLGAPTFVRTGQVGDGREAAARNYVLAHSTAGDPDSVLAAFDAYARDHRMLVNVGDEKGLILDAALERAKPRLLLELGAYCGYSAVRTGRALSPDDLLVSVEFNPANAEIARAVIAHAGLADRVSVVDGSIGDDGKTLARLADHGFGPGTLDFVFIDHDKDAYLPDLETLIGTGWFHPGSVVLADNVGVPGAPGYRRYMQQEQGRTWQTTEHRTHVEYQSLLRDLVLESVYQG
ncbi:O-methyltransferase [Nocardia yamanashiensis]|uniref:O-methyltransferase n=1 Tax=Nocardia yamanashiensis TaxID=209247 RepID=UPI00083192C4|nr:O-methyltransferase [Nocardia yamanashiensis]